MIRKSRPDFDLKGIPEDDKNVFDMLTAGKTSGVFQMESAGMTGVCVGLKPRTIEELMAIIAFTGRAHGQHTPLHRLQAHPNALSINTLCLKIYSRPPTAA
jgi:DNA polymerase-3 subunit alpha